jgi:hypothetical protein
VTHFLNVSIFMLPLGRACAGWGQYQQLKVQKFDTSICMTLWPKSAVLSMLAEAFPLSSGPSHDDVDWHIAYGQEDHSRCQQAGASRIPYGSHSFAPAMPNAQLVRRTAGLAKTFKHRQYA